MQRLIHMAALGRRRRILILLTILLNLPFDHGESTSPASTSTSIGDEDVRVAYWPSFTGFPASAIDTSYFSHVYYAFLLPSPTTYTLNVTSYDVERLTEFANATGVWSLPVKAMLSVGGGGGEQLSDTFSRMASREGFRAGFINSTIQVAREYGFDGVDIDWEFPSNESDMLNLGLLL